MLTDPSDYAKCIKMRPDGSYRKKRSRRRKPLASRLNEMLGTAAIAIRQTSFFAPMDGGYGRIDGLSDGNRRQPRANRFVKKRKRKLKTYAK